jgi:DNA-binding HxlR family transcriptional regulator
VTEFRYAQFCPLARAAEILAERWTLLIVRELLLGPQRFSDLRRRLPGVSSSVLSARMAQLEARALVVRRELPPPAPAQVFELSEVGAALRPVVLEMARWGAHFLEAPQPGDHFEPDWLRLGFDMLARRSPTPALRVGIRVPHASGEVAFCVVGGTEGTRIVLDSPLAAPEPDLILEGPALVLLGLASGGLTPEQALAHPELRSTGERAELADFVALFDSGPPPESSL